MRWYQNVWDSIKVERDAIKVVWYASKVVSIAIKVVWNAI